ncbi:MAG: TIGR02996 domain-containing protein [Alphaproteobacteria bacterium]|nr:TIGR02996 domain-containing protein [Alphaproteobacteria bacterium]
MQRPEGPDLEWALDLWRRTRSERASRVVLGLDRGASVLRRTLSDVIAGDLETARDRLAAIERLEPDPRVAEAIQLWLAALPYRDEPGAAAFWDRVLALVPVHADRSVRWAEDLAREVGAFDGALAKDLAHRVLRHQWTVEPDPLRWRLREDKVSRGERRRLAEIEATLESGDDGIGALFQAVWDDPVADGPRLVLADALQQRGDPRGEFIALDFRRDDEPASRRAWYLQRTHRTRWLGDGFLKAGIEWDRGFPCAVDLSGPESYHVSGHPPELGPLLRALVGSDAWRTVRRLTVRDGWDDPIVAFLEHPVLDGLEDLRWIQAHHLEGLVRRGPRLRRLGVHSGPEDLARVVALANAWGLEALDVDVWGDPEAAEAALADANAPELRVVWGEPGPQEIGVDLAPPSLETLVRTAPSTRRRISVESRNGGGFWRAREGGDSAGERAAGGFGPAHVLDPRRAVRWSLARGAGPLAGAPPVVLTAVADAFRLADLRALAPVLPEVHLYGGPPGLVAAFEGGEPVSIGCLVLEIHDPAVLDAADATPHAIATLVLRDRQGLLGIALHRDASGGFREAELAWTRWPSRLEAPRRTLHAIAGRLRSVGWHADHLAKPASNAEAQAKLDRWLESVGLERAEARPVHRASSDP